MPKAQENELENCNKHVNKLLHAIITLDKIILMGGNRGKTVFVILV